MPYWLIENHILASFSTVTLIILRKHIALLSATAVPSLTPAHPAFWTESIYPNHVSGLTALYTYHEKNAQNIHHTL